MIEREECKNHPGRPGLGVCPGCGTTVCEECSTRLDGVLQCRSCLDRRRAAGGKVRWRSAGAVFPAVLLVPLAWLALGGALYAAAWLIAAWPWSEAFRWAATP
jgi:hypothetical protein